MTDAAKHAENMKIQQATQRQRVQAASTPDRGLALVHTGEGKGKSSSAFGVIVRARLGPEGGRGAVHQGCLEDRRTPIPLHRHQGHARHRFPTAGARPSFTEPTSADCPPPFPGA